MGVERVRAWRSRGRLPVAVDATATLVEVHLCEDRCVMKRRMCIADYERTGFNRVQGLLILSICRLYDMFAISSG
jgi:hypothetical protein